MSIHIEQREPDSPLVRTIWRSHSTGNGHYTGVADSSWGLIVLKYKGATQISFSGPTTRAVSIPYCAGMEFLGVCFQLGVFLPRYAVGDVVDTAIALPNATQDSFWLDDTACPFPDYDHVETFVEKLVRNRFLACNSVVEQALAGNDQPLTQRTVQRHFLRTTGLTQGTIRQIERARAAVELLERGVPILDVVHAVGYSDQPHLTKALKRFVGQTPAQIAARKTPYHN